MKSETRSFNNGELGCNTDTILTILRWVRPLLVSFAAVIRAVTRHATFLPERCVTSDDPNNGCEGD